MVNAARRPEWRCWPQVTPRGRPLGGTTTKRLCRLRTRRRTAPGRLQREATYVVFPSGGVAPASSARECRSRRARGGGNRKPPRSCKFCLTSWPRTTRYGGTDAPGLDRLAIARTLIFPTGGVQTDGSEEEGQEEEVDRPHSQVSSFPQARFPQAGLLFPGGTNTLPVDSHPLGCA